MQKNHLRSRKILINARSYRLYGVKLRGRWVYNRMHGLIEHSNDVLAFASGRNLRPANDAAYRVKKPIQIGKRSQLEASIFLTLRTARAL